MAHSSILRRMTLVGFLFFYCLCLAAYAQERTTEGLKENAKPAPPPAFHFTDITASTGIRFEHVVSPEKKYLYESVSGGVLLLDYDRDGWLDIYFTNAPSVAMALRGEKARSALYRNNHDGTFTDVTDKAGVAYPCWAMGGAVADYDNDGWPDILLTCQEGLVLYHNNGNGTFANVTKEAHLTDPRWATGAAFGDYDGDGFVDLMVTRYVDFDLKNLPPFEVGPTCHYRGIPVAQPFHAPRTALHRSKPEQAERGSGAVQASLPRHERRAVPRVSAAVRIP